MSKLQTTIMFQVLLFFTATVTVVVEGTLCIQKESGFKDYDYHNDYTERAYWNTQDHQSHNNIDNSGMVLPYQQGGYQDSYWSNTHEQHLELPVQPVQLEPPPRGPQQVQEDGYNNNHINPSYNYWSSYSDGFKFIQEGIYDDLCV